MPKKPAKEPSSQTAPVPVGTDPGDSMSSVLNMVEKKVRNLEKRRTKLESFKESMEKGKSLVQDQKDALEKMATVDEQLAVLRDLQKNILTIQQETARQRKKQAKAELAQERERCRATLGRGVASALRVTSVLNLIDDATKEDLREGSNGAPQFTESHLGALDQFYQLINPTPSHDKNFSAQLDEARQHLVLSIEESTTEIPNTEGVTYKTISEMLTTLQESGYLVAVPEEEAEEVEVEENGAEPDGPCDVGEEDYDVISDRDVPPDDQVQVVMQQYEKQQAQMTQQQLAQGGGTQSYNRDSTPECEVAPAQLYEQSGVDFPGLDPNCGENPGLFFNESSMVAGNPAALLDPSSPSPSPVAVVTVPVAVVPAAQDLSIPPPMTAGEVERGLVTTPTGPPSEVEPTLDSLPSYNLKARAVQPRATGSYAALAGSGGSGQEKTTPSYSAATQSKVGGQEVVMDFNGPPPASRDYSSGQPRISGNPSNAARDQSGRSRDGGNRGGRNQSNYRGKPSGFRGDSRSTGGPTQHNGSGTGPGPRSAQRGTTAAAPGGGGRGGGGGGRPR